MTQNAKEREEDRYLTIVKGAAFILRLVFLVDTEFELLSLQKRRNKKANKQKAEERHQNTDRSKFFMISDNLVIARVLTYIVRLIAARIIQNGHGLGERRRVAPAEETTTSETKRARTITRNCGRKMKQERKRNIESFLCRAEQVDRPDDFSLIDIAVVLGCGIQRKHAHLARTRAETCRRREKSAYHV